MNPRKFTVRLNEFEQVELIRIAEEHGKTPEQILQSGLRLMEAYAMVQRFKKAKGAFTEFIDGFYQLHWSARAWWAHLVPGAGPCALAWNFGELGREDLEAHEDNAPWGRGF